MATLQGKKILIIDDAADIRHFVKSILQNDGAEVFDAEGVEEGIKLASERAPHLIVSDLMMPGKTGFDFLRYLKKSDSLSRIPVIVLSGLADKASIKDAVALGAIDYILKPIKATLLLQKVRKGLNSSSFLNFSFQKEDRPQASVVLGAEAISISEVALQIESSIKLAGDETVSISGELLDELGCSGVVMRTSPRGGAHLEKGRYISEVNFVGMDSDLLKKMRNHIKDWK